MNDIGIIIGISSLFIIMGFLIPFINADLNLSNANIYADGQQLYTDVSDDPTGSVSIFQIMLSIFSMFFWTFGQLPLIADIFLLIPRLALALIIARNVWIGGGG